MSARPYVFYGTITELMANRTVGKNNTPMRDFIVENDPAAKYPSPVKFTAKGTDNVKLLDKFHKGDKCFVKFYLNGRRWDGPKGTAYFIDLSAVDILTPKEWNESEGGKKDGEAEKPAEPAADAGADSVDDMPF